MKKLFIVLFAVSMVNAQCAEIKASELKLKACQSSVFNRGANYKGLSKDAAKLVSSGMKDCRAAVKLEQTKEREEKKREKINAQITKLQLKLKG